MTHMITGTIEENMKLALQQEQIMRDCGPMDPYYRIAKSNVEYYMDCAAALERGEQTIEEKVNYHFR
ncbi:hypothetical protein EVB81_123 [Rhizobium phage RHph_I46]|uniref:Uncharacterized protein n=1 Tax=Rhizobium phage RHph_I1_9 TaxID=2509729 RepID=A0A7S5RJE6_9CAUD|nr:hypothetical protein PP936_gp122 [Rhizobium phage RHph_I1_9]QIG69692.1 hypothetical protein EVB81_123 [Rhizobium phage RHph_I46]QIG70973.1 hypothetical protein EVB92_123 [Rhizobium phage RHph_I9]QIG73559.1 hypothetical protein EVC04_122 [Rhizobium phage RHph_I1_9]QIG76312.1 hypothetical protein EVC25_123 [Rhizobium phage RHph_I34]